MMNEREAMGIVAMLVAAYPTPSWPEETIKLYVLELANSKADAEPARVAVRNWYRSRPERPSVAELLHVTADASWQERKRVERQAIDAKRVLALPSPEERKANKQRVTDIIAQLTGKLGTS